MVDIFAVYGLESLRDLERGRPQLTTQAYLGSGNMLLLFTAVHILTISPSLGKSRTPG
jgi:hypothetical protein